MVIKSPKKHATGKMKGSPGMKAQTPQPQKKAGFVNKKKTPKSEPHPKRKKLSEEISDEEFEEFTNIVKEQEKVKKKLGKSTPKPKSPEKELSDEFESDDDDDLDLSDLEFDSDDDSDDVDSEDDGESEQQQNPAKNKKLAKKFKSMMENAGSDSDEDDDEDEDDDDDESSEDDDSPPPAKKIKQKEGTKKDKQQKQSTNKESINDPKNKKRKAEDTPAVNGKQQKVTATQVASDTSAQDERDSRTIFINRLPINTTDETVKELFKKSLQKTIVDVRRKRIKKNVHAYVEFQTKDQAKLGHECVKGKKIGSQDIIVDFVGKASVNRPQQKMMDPDAFDPLRLYITGFNRSTTVAQLQKIFKGATRVQVPTRKKSKKAVGYAFAHYKTEAECKQAHDSIQGTRFKDRPLVVLFAKKTTEAKKSDKRPEQLEAKVEAKKQKLEQKKKKAKDESSDEEEDDDDEEDIEDDDESVDEEDDDGEDDDSEEDDDDDNDDSDEDTGSE